MYTCLASKGTRLKEQFSPTEYSWTGKSESCTAKGFSGPIPAGLASRDYAKQRVQNCVYCQGSGLGIRWARLSTWDYLRPGRTPCPSRVQTSGKGRTHPAPTSSRIASTTFNGGSSAKQAKQAQEPLAGSYPQEKDRKRNAKWAHFVLLSGR